MEMVNESEVTQFYQRGWVCFAADEMLMEWVENVRPVALALAERPDLRDAWLRCGGTWFVGVNVLGNQVDGAIPAHGVPPLVGTAVNFIHENLGLTGFEWDAGQVSVCYPGYPQPSTEESEAAFRFRVKRHAAHVDGIGRVGTGRRLTEAHAFVLGIPITPMSTDAASLSVWEGSHEVFRRAFRNKLAGVEPADWSTIELFDLYREVRNQCFESCPRISIAAQPGQAYLVHRLALHGVAPWHPDEAADLRAVIYFRPTVIQYDDPTWWLTLP